MTDKTELTKQYFKELVQHLTEIEHKKILVKEVVDAAKESEIDVKLLKKAAALFVKNSFEETIELNAAVEEFYKEVTDY